MSEQERCLQSPGRAGVGEERIQHAGRANRAHSPQVETAEVRAQPSSRVVSTSTALRGGRTIQRSI